MPRSPDDPATGGGGEYVAVDLETTGLNPTADRIIEIGAVRFGAEGPRERFRTFVSPGRPLPPAIRMLTKIEDADLVGAPPPSLAVHEFAAFARGLPLVAHNAPFDLGFLAEAGLQPQAPAFDSYELASVLLPTATRLDLSSLAGSLGVEISEAHRALADAEATAAVFLRLLERLKRLPGATLRDLVRLAEQSAWSLAPLFAGALDRQGIGAAGDALAPGALAREAQALPPPLRRCRSSRRWTRTRSRRASPRRAAAPICSPASRRARARSRWRARSRPTSRTTANWPSRRGRGPASRSPTSCPRSRTRCAATSVS